MKKIEKTDENSKIWKNLHASDTDCEMKIFDIFDDFHP